MNTTAETLQLAIEFAVDSHRGQVRKGNKRPYILHPLSVMARLMHIKDSSINIYTLACAAVLHDVVEDCGVKLETIISMFGLKIALLVQELTSDKEMIQVLGKNTYLSMKMISMSSYALTIKLVDRLDNIEDMKDMDPEFRKKQILDTRHVLHELVTNRARITGTQRKLIADIYDAMQKYEPYMQNTKEVG